MKALTKAEMAALDDQMVKMGIDIPRMMELAGLFVAITAAKMAKGKILVLSGTGNNGGDGLAAGRHLLNWGHKVDIAFATNTNKLRPMPLRQWKILKNMQVKETINIVWNKYSLIIDGLLGYNIKGNPKGKYAKLITAANKSKIPILAIDLPSGLDATSGKPAIPCIRATSTIALSAAKKGLLKRAAKPYVGKLLVSYMTVPDVVSRKFKLSKVFNEKKLIVAYR